MEKIFKFLLSAVLINFFISCSSLEGSGINNTDEPVVESTSEVIIKLTNLKQIIDGFGAATVWNGKLSATEMDVSFRNGEGQLGLTICRVRFDPNGNDNDEIANASNAKARGAIILASVWSPPASMKSNNNTIGGFIKESFYHDYALWLSNNRVKFGNVDIISIQNEPNIKVNYESCEWTINQILDFCKYHASKIGGNVMIPECYNFDVTYSDPVLNDSVASSNISYIGGHIYGAKPFYYTNAIQKGKKVWMTEHYYDPDDIETCLKMAKEINDTMYYNMNAYVWWYLKEPKCNLIENGGIIKKKGYVISQFSKFIRPGYYRVEATYNPVDGVYVTAYKGSNVVVVVINENNFKVSQKFVFENGSPTNFIKYTTSSVKNLKKNGVITTVENSFTDILDSKSVTTFVEQN